MADSQLKSINAAQKADISPGQCRAARGLLDISQRQLAEAAGGSVTAIIDYESNTRTPRPPSRQLGASILRAPTCPAAQTGNLSLILLQGLLRLRRHSVAGL